MWRRPIVQVFGGGVDIVPRLGTRLLSVRVTDAAGQDSDTAEIAVADPGRRLPLPNKGAMYTIHMGWADTGPALMGAFSVQTVSHRGHPREGEVLIVSLRAADFVDRLKAHGREQVEDGTTAGDLFRKLAGQAGMGAVVDGAIAGKRLAYRLRWDQSIIDFATEVAEELGATVKPAGGKLVVMKRGGGSGAGGTALMPIMIRKRRGFAWDITIEERPVYGRVAASWHDGKSGRRRIATHPTGRLGQFLVLQHLYRSEAEAKDAAGAEAYEQGHNQGSGSFEIPGMPHARAEAPVIASEYGPGIDGLWKAESIDHEVTKTRGYVTTVTVGSGDETK